MCWIRKGNVIPILARKDKEVYKVLRPINGKPNMLIAPIMLNHTYEINKIAPKISIAVRYNLKNNNIITTIEEGYHSDNTLDIAIKRFNFMDDLTLGVYKCIIPKDSIYFINDYDEVVSDTIIIKEYVNIWTSHKH